MEVQEVSGNVSYDEAPVAELTIGEVDYRVDAGRGSAVAVSHRPSGSWTWSFLVEGRWDGSRLKAKTLDFEVLKALAEALAGASRELAE